MSHQYKTKPTPNTKRFRVQDLHQKTDPKFAVFARTTSGKSAHFSYLRNDMAEALENARHFASTLVSHGETDFTYYVVEIKHRVGIEHGKPVDESML